MIEAAKAKVDAIFDAALVKYKPFLPFGGKYLLLVRDYIDKNFDMVVGYLREHGNGPDYDAAVDMLIAWLKASVPMPGYLFFLAPMKDVLLGQLASYLKDNKSVFVDDLIGLDQPKATTPEAK